MVTESELKSALEVREKELQEALELCTRLKTECCEFRKAWAEIRLKGQGIPIGTPVTFDPFRKKTNGIFRGVSIVETAEGLANRIEIGCTLKSGKESTLLLPWGYLDSLKVASPTDGQD